MDAVIRMTVVYLFLVAIFRLAGRRTLGEATTFDLLLVLIISETVQQALVDDDNSITHALILVVTLVMLEVGMAFLKQRSKAVDALVEGSPVVLVRDGQPQREAMRRERMDEEDILEATRQTHGLARMDQVAHVVLERTGKVSVVPRENA